MNIWSHNTGHWRSLEISRQLFFVILKLWVFILLFRLIPPLGLLVLFIGFYPKLGAIWPSAFLQQMVFHALGLFYIKDAISGSAISSS